ncbi:hypothetical protein OQA88_1006 [Cercophora sp. LCS_1]
MTSTLEQLPNELLLDITQHLTRAGVASLVACSRHLHRSLLNELYNDERERRHAIAHACKHGNVDTLQRIRTYHREVNPATPYWDYVGSRSVNPLCVAVKFRQLGTFEFLLAGYNDQDDNVESDAGSLRVLRLSDLMSQSDQVPRMMARICSPHNVELLRAYLKSPLPGLLRKYHSPEVVLPLVRAIGIEAPLDIIDLLLDRGANPNQLWTHGSSAYTSPLSAALTANSRYTFQLLLKRGADINGPTLNRPVRALLHIPVFVAAYQLCDHGTSMMQLCLDHGANINHEGHVLDPPKGSATPQARLTPLDAFFNSVQKWDKVYALSPAQGFMYLHLHGALSAVQVRQHATPAPSDPTSSINNPPPNILRTLLDKYKTWGLVEPAFRETVRLLSQTPGIGDEFRFRHNDVLLDGASNPRENSSWMSLTSEAEGWRELLLGFTKNPKIRSTGLLSWLTCGGGAPSPWKMVRFDRTGVERRVPGSLYFVAVKFALESGANVNKVDDAGLTALRRLCYRFQEEIGQPGEAAYKETEYEAVLHALRRLVGMLVEAGADASLLIAEGILVE